jgi:hypothetical protein
MTRRPPIDRRSQRVQIAIPVFVYGNDPSVDPLQETTHTKVVNAKGGSIFLTSKVVVGQKLLLVNMKSQEEINCTVATLHDEAKEMVEVGIVFDRPAPRFWGLAFPPENWDATLRKRPEHSHRPK